MTEITVVVVLDKATVQQLQWTLQTWYKNRPEMFEWPWLVLYDGSQIPCPSIPHVGDARYVDWDLHTRRWSMFASQRAKMLSAFLYGSEWIDTDWWMKIDTDAVALRNDVVWIDESWFRDNDNVYVANPWPYTKAKGGGGDIFRWIEKLEDWIPPRVEPLMRRHVVGNKIKIRRMASWLSFYNTSLSRMLLSDLQMVNMPVPSQDTLVWYWAWQHGYAHVLTKFKNRGWTNVPRMEKLIATCRQVMEA